METDLSESSGIENIPDLTNDVSFLSPVPVFVGSYSIIYKGSCRGEEVSTETPPTCSANPLAGRNQSTQCDLNGIEHDEKSMLWSVLLCVSDLSVEIQEGDHRLSACQPSQYHSILWIYRGYWAIWASRIFDITGIMAFFSPHCRSRSCFSGILTAIPKSPWRKRALHFPWRDGYNWWASSDSTYNVQWL